MQAKKLAAQVAELRALPDNKRCFDCAGSLISHDPSGRALSEKPFTPSRFGFQTVMVAFVSAEPAPPFTVTIPAESGAVTSGDEGGGTGSVGARQPTTTTAARLRSRVRRDERMATSSA